MLKLTYLLTRGAGTATICFCSVRTEDILCKSQRYRETSESGISKQKLSVTNPVTAHFFNEVLFDPFLTYDIFKLHEVNLVIIK